MNILIVGLGSIVHKHLQAIYSLNSGAKIWALRSSTSYENVEGITSITKLSEVKETLDFAIIANPTIFHKEAIQNLIPLQIPLFIEKPVFHNLENLDSILQQINPINYVACNLRFHNIILETKNWLNNNTYTINEVNIYCGSYLPNWRPNKNFKDIYSAQSALGGGVHLDLIHEIDYMYYLLGTPIASNKFFSNKSSLDIDAIDYANYLFHYKNFSASVILNYYRKDTKRSIEIVTDKGTLYADLIANQIYFDGKMIYENFENMQATYDKQMQYFIKCIKENKVPENNVEAALEVLKLVLN